VGGDGASGAASDRPLVGRDDDPAVLRSFLERAAIEGGALALSGDAVPAYVEREQTIRQAWLEGVATRLAPARPV
jgi:hypothetical protein